MKTKITNRVAEIRKGRGIGATDLARRVEVSRQTIYAIEAGTYVPNTEVALRLAQELEVSVDELFTLGENSQKAPESLAAEVLTGSPAETGQPVRICQVGPRWVGVPVSASRRYGPIAGRGAGNLLKGGKQNIPGFPVVFRTALSHHHER